MPASPSKPGWLRRCAAWGTAWLFRHGQKPYAIWSLSALCVLDGFLPMVPAEFIALALMVLQPRRVLLVVLAFAVSAAISAGLLATWIAFWSLVRVRTDIARQHDEQYAASRARLEKLLRECGLAAERLRRAAIAVTALVDGLWLELCLSPEAFSAAEAGAIARSALDAVLR